VGIRKELTNVPTFSAGYPGRIGEKGKTDPICREKKRSTNGGKTAKRKNKNQEHHPSREENSLEQGISRGGKGKKASGSEKRKKEFADDLRGEGQGMRKGKKLTKGWPPIGEKKKKRSNGKKKKKEGEAVAARQAHAEKGRKKPLRKRIPEERKVLRKKNLKRGK